jgi:hypothetical protein
MAEEKRKILVLVEGAKTDVALMERLLSAYQIDVKYEIVSYCTNIYTLYHVCLRTMGWTCQCECGNDGEKGVLRFIYILLNFDLDPHPIRLQRKRICGMERYLVDV